MGSILRIPKAFVQFVQAEAESRVKISCKGILRIASCDEAINYLWQIIKLYLSEVFSKIFMVAYLLNACEFISGQFKCFE